MTTLPFKYNLPVNFSKKTLPTVLTLSLVLPFSLMIPTTANAAVKTGDFCKKAGAKSVAAGEKFTCTKSGKKLIWKKVVPQKLPAPVAEIPVSMDSLDTKAVPKKAYASVINALSTRTRSAFTPTKYVGQNVQQARMDQEVGGLNRAIDLWAPYFQPDVFQVVYVGKGDEQWLESKSSELGLQSMVPPGETWTDRMKMFTPCSFAMAGVARNIPTFVQCLDPAYLGGYRQTGPHEYTHLFQRGVGGLNMHRMAWYTEGSASYFGWTLGFYPYDPNSSDRTRWLTGMFSNMTVDAKSDFQSKDLQRLKSRMQIIAQNSNAQSVSNTSYGAGGLATEVLVGVYGFDKFVEFTKNIQQNQNLSSLLMQTYGFNEDYFYEKVAPYIWAHLPN
jgi:hypothetical protein